MQLVELATQFEQIKLNFQALLKLGMDNLVTVCKPLQSCQSFQHTIASRLPVRYSNSLSECNTYLS